MREIKFRAWDKDLEEMHGVDTIDFYNGTVQFSNNDIELYSNVTLMQFTGLKDKNGKEIYEGDILGWIYHEEELTDELARDLYVISFRNASFVWDCFRGGRIIDTDGERLRSTHEFEVLGNIYENPELLKGNKDSKRFEELYG